MCLICQNIARRPALMVLSSEHLSAAVADLSARSTLSGTERASLTLARVELRARVADCN